MPHTRSLVATVALPPVQAPFAAAAAQQGATL